MTKSPEDRITVAGLDPLLAKHGDVLRRAVQSADGLKQRLTRPAAPGDEPATVFRLQPRPDGDD
jgi:hypothetical protein